MGNRDARGREKKKPKKKEIKLPNRSAARPMPDYKPVVVPQPPQTGDKPS